MIIGFDGSRAFVGERTGTENYSYQLLKALLAIDRKNFYRIYVNPYRVNPKHEARNSKQYQNSNNRNSKRLENLIFEHVDLFRISDFGFRNFEVRPIFWPRLWTQGGLAVECLKNPPDVLFVPAHTMPIIRRPNLKTVFTRVSPVSPKILSQLVHRLRRETCQQNYRRFRKYKKRLTRKAWL